MTSVLDETGATKTFAYEPNTHEILSETDDNLHTVTLTKDTSRRVRSVLQPKERTSMAVSKTYWIARMNLRRLGKWTQKTGSDLEEINDFPIASNFSLQYFYCDSYFSPEEGGERRHILVAFYNPHFINIINSDSHYS